MNNKVCIIPQILLLIWFFLDMIGVYFDDSYLVTRSYKEDGIWFIIYLIAVLLFVFKEKIGKWAVAVWSSIWFLMQFMNHEWITIFGDGFMGKTENKKKFFSESLKWLEIEDRYVPDVYHTILQIFILAVVITSITYIRKTRKSKVK